MDVKNPDVREVLRDIYNFLINTLSNETLSGNAKARKEELVQKLAVFPDVAPPYIDMNRCAKNKNQSEEYVDVSTSGNHSDSKLYEEFPEQSSGLSMNQDVSQPAVVNYENLILSVSKIKCSAKKFGPLWRKAKTFFVEHSTCSWGGILGDTLYIYNSDKEAKPANIILVHGYKARPAPAYCLRDGKKRDCCFELVCPGKKSYQFIARTAKDMEQWIACINEASSGGLEETDTEMNSGKRQLPSLPPRTNQCEQYDDIQTGPTEETDEVIYHDIRELNIAAESFQKQQSSVTDETDSEVLYDDCANNRSCVYYNLAEQNSSGLCDSNQRACVRDNEIDYDDEDDIYDDVNKFIRTPEVPTPRYPTNEASNSIQQVVQKIETRNKKFNFLRVFPESTEGAKIDKIDNCSIPSDNFYEPIDNPTDDCCK